jgi:hypothetical protein
MQAARHGAMAGRFAACTDAVPMAEINGFFRDDLKGHTG